MEKPEIIREKIELLKKQLEESENYHRYQLIEELNSDEEIGFFKIGRAKRILKLLYDGVVLLLSHEIYGDYEVSMNTNRNRTLVKCVGDHEPSINEENIMTFIVWCNGKWFIDTKTVKNDRN